MNAPVIHRAKQIPVIMGGLTISALAEEAREHCTSVVIGEGEPLWNRVLADFERGALLPVYRQQPPGSLLERRIFRPPLPIHALAPFGRNHMGAARRID